MPSAKVKSDSARRSITLLLKRIPLLSPDIWDSMGTGRVWCVASVWFDNMAVVLG